MAQPGVGGGLLRPTALLLLAAVLGGACTAWLTLRTPAASADSGNTVTLSSCDESSFDAAVSSALSSGTGTVSVDCTGTITLSQEMVLSAGQNLTVDASGEPSGSVILSGGDAHRVFDVEGGSLTLDNLTVSGGSVVGSAGTAGIAGAAGAAGDDGENGGNGDDATGDDPTGQPGENGTPGGAGNLGDAGGDGGTGSVGNGGAMLIESGASVTLIGDVFSNSTATGGTGGSGGAGGRGGLGGDGGNGGLGGDGPGAPGDGGDGGDGADGAVAADGGAGGKGGAGGIGEGGAIWDGGSLSVQRADRPAAVRSARQLPINRAV